MFFAFDYYYAFNSLPHNPTFNEPNEEGFGKHFRKRRKCWKPALSPFCTMFSPLSKREIVILATFNLLSASAFDLAISNFLLFGKDKTNKFWV